MDLAVINTKLDHIIKTIGEEDPSGAGGTGLSGGLARAKHENAIRFASLESKVGHLYSLKHIGIGILVTVGATGTLLLLGAKALFLSWLK